ncbi:MAG: hypothetical protein GY694_16005 [Gammaproteobacteria bacterium]|nr:hypothetical protein [Gammaproteobacteria bacterium]
MDLNKEFSLNLLAFMLQKFEPSFLLQIPYSPYQNDRGGLMPGREVELVKWIGRFKL